MSEVSGAAAAPLVFGGMIAYWAYVKKVTFGGPRNS